MWVLVTFTGRLDQSLQILQASLSPCFMILRNITLMDMEKQLPGRNNKSIIGRVLGTSLSLFLDLSTWFARLETSCFVWTARCRNTIVSAVHGQLTTTQTSTSTRSTGPIAHFAKPKFIVCRRYFVVVAIERLLAILSKDVPHDSGRWDGETGSKTIAGGSSGWNLGRRLLDYERHHPD